METFGKQEGQPEVALRTVPIVGNRRILVNCLLDEGSDTTYVNEDVINELGLTGEKEPITVKVANDQTLHFISSSFEIGLESTDGRVDTKITAKTSNKICGGLKAVNWIKTQDRWNHLTGIPFPRLAKRNRIDVLLGADHYELMYSMKEVTGGPNEPCARLCLLVWTACHWKDSEPGHKGESLHWRPSHISLANRKKGAYFTREGHLRAKLPAETFLGSGEHWNYPNRSAADIGRQVGMG